VGISLGTLEFIIADCPGENAARHVPWSPRSTG
jgi:hypothetical protein